MEDRLPILRTPFVTLGLQSNVGQTIFGLRKVLIKASIRWTTILTAWRRSAIILLVQVFLVAGQVGAFASITINEGRGGKQNAATCAIEVSGPIHIGDADILRRKLRSDTSKIDNYPSHLPTQQYVVCLDGPGGDYSEGILMARVLSEFDVTTRVKTKRKCLSACAIAFLGGRHNHRSGEGWSPSREIEPGATVGFHAPSLDIPQAGYTRPFVISAYNSALDSIAELNQYSVELYISPILIRNLIAARGENFYFVDTITKLAIYQIDLVNYAPPKLNGQSQAAACHNAWDWYLIRQQAKDMNAEWGGRDEAIFNSFNAAARLPNTYQFSPFDGVMVCKVRKPETASKAYPVTVILSENADLSDPRLKESLDSRVLFPGPTNIASIPLSITRKSIFGSCEVWAGGKNIEREPCQYSARKKVETYKWPSGAKTIVDKRASGGSVLINGAKATIVDQPKVCYRNERTKNTFCFVKG